MSESLCILIVVIICFLFIAFSSFVEKNHKSNQDKIKHSIMKTELIEKIKKGNYTEKELDYILSSDKNLRAIFRTFPH